MKREHFRKCCSCIQRTPPINQWSFNGNRWLYRIQLNVNLHGIGGGGGWGGVLFRWNEVFSLSPRAWPCGPLFWPKSNAGVWWPPTPPLDTPMSFLEVGALNLGCGPFMKVKKQMMRQNMKCGLLPAKMSPVFSWITVNKQSANVHFSLLTATIFKRNIHCPKRKRKEEIKKLLNKEFNT